MKTTMRWALAAAALAAPFAQQAEAQDGVLTGEQIAVEMEVAAATLHDRAERWADAATLYLAAAELREQGDAQAQKNFFVAANLLLETGDVEGAIAALEVAGSRALAVGDAELARERFVDAALVAQKAGLSREHERLSYRTTEVVTATNSARRTDVASLGAAFPRR